MIEEKRRLEEAEAILEAQKEKKRNRNKTSSRVYEPKVTIMLSESQLEERETRLFRMKTLRRER